MKPEGRAGNDGNLDLACFAAHGRIYAFDVREVREIVSDQEVTELPGVREPVEGVIDLRGAVIPVVDLGRLLAGGGAAAVAGRRMAVLQVDGVALALRVERAVDVVSVAAESLAEPPPLASEGEGELCAAVVRRPEGPPVLLLSARRLVLRLRRAAGEGECAA
jgi:purine-binding chemotaxis protein CheW